MPRRNHPKQHPHGRSLAKLSRVGPGLDPLIDREKRNKLIADWMNTHGGQIRDRWNWYRKAGTNKSGRHVVIVCHECDRLIRQGQGIVTARYNEDDLALAFHWQRGAPNCWNRFLSRKIREAAEHALFDSHQEIA
jgi:hypothetical protein